MTNSPQSKNYNSAHQLIGLIVVFFVLLQALLGFFQHRIFKAKQQHSIVGTVHRFLGVGVICIGIINGGL